MSSIYRGRFAPSPTGPLHFGSLVAALVSFLEARTHDGTWLVRIEDLDPLRETSDATTRILRTLEAHCLNWDEEVLYQSRRGDIYQSRLEQLVALGRVYRCPCSRRDLAERQGKHPNLCREHPLRHYEQPTAWRFAVQSGPYAWDDVLQGHQHYDLDAERDDFVVQRKEGFFAYQLAVVCDDAAQQVQQVVRGSDLLDSTPLQLALLAALGLPQPSYLHFPVIVGDNKQKLSKQNHAPAIEDSAPGRNLWQALVALNQGPPNELAKAPAEQVLAWARENWSLARVPAKRTLPMPEPA